MMKKLKELIFIRYIGLFLFMVFVPGSVVFAISFRVLLWLQGAK